jgi:23S rRNA (guanosine2251-2'-O)-methyltransferase
VTNPEVAPFEVEPYDVVSLTQPEGYEQALPVTPNGDDVRATGVGDVDCLPVTVAEAELSAKPRKSRAKAKPAAAPEAAPEAAPDFSSETEASEESDVVSDEAAEEAKNLPGDRLEGRNPVMEALKAGRTLNKMWVQKGQHDPVMQRIISRAIEAGVVIQELDKRSMDKMAVTHGHQGVLAQVAAHDYVTLDQILDAAKEKGQPAFLLVLDELKESYNLGSILRIADAAGVHGVVIPERRSVSLDAAVAKASAGAVEHVAVARVTNIVQTLETLKERGLWIAGTDAESATDYSNADLKGPLAIVVGSEGEGLGHSVREHCDFLVGIPMAGQVNSLNAAVATGIVVFEAARQRRAALAGR